MYDIMQLVSNIVGRGGGGYAELKNNIGTNCDFNTKLGMPF